MIKVISIMNNKGGVGKTTTTANLGAALALIGWKVLLIDLDPQGNLTQSLKLEGDIWTNIKEGTTPTPTKLKGHKGRLYGVGANESLAESELYLPQAEDRLNKVKDILKPLRKKFDFILIDNEPSLGLLAINSLFASDLALLPLTADYLSLGGTGRINRLGAEINEKRKKNPLKMLFVITRYKSRLSLNRQAADFIRKLYGDYCLTTTIREGVALAEAPGKGEDIFTYSPRSNGAKDYESLARELIEKLKDFEFGRLE